MKFSILLPTRNRLEYLKLAVTSVLRQDFEDWQIVISDNRSEEDVEGYVSSLGEPRILYRQTERVVAVTENWNRALAHSDGEYIVMLGDDDALLPGYMSRMSDLIAEFDRPEVIYTKALLFTYPGVDRLHPGGSLVHHGCAEFYGDRATPFLLSHDQALDAVRAAMSFRLRYDFNAQFALISRSMIDSLSELGDVYQSAFPDYYSMNAAFLRAQRILVDPAPRVVIGVTPKSYGYFHVNRLEAEGRTFLGGSAASAPAGTNINVGWLDAMNTLERNLAGGLGLRVDHRRYRFVQAAHVHERYRAGAIDREEVRRLERELPLGERVGYRLLGDGLGLAHRVLPDTLRTVMVGLAHRLVGQIPEGGQSIEEGRYADALEVCDAWAVTAAVAGSR